MVDMNVMLCIKAVVCCRIKEVILKINHLSIHRKISNTTCPLQLNLNSKEKKTLAGGVQGPWRQSNLHCRYFAVNG